MGFFSKTPVQSTEATSTTGSVNLTKGARISLDKTPTATIVVSNGWKAKNKDYDLKALVLYKDGSQVYVGAANRDEALSVPDNAVVHGGDVKEGSADLETITIKWHPDIVSVALSSYSAIENGRGSFRQYGVYVSIANGQQVVTLEAADVSGKKHSYTLCFGEIIFSEGGTFDVVNLELYSAPDSERRITYRYGKVVMDGGPEGRTK